MNTSEPIEKAISKYKFRPRILFINGKIANEARFFSKQISNKYWEIN